MNARPLRATHLRTFLLGGAALLALGTISLAAWAKLTLTERASVSCMLTAWGHPMGVALSKPSMVEDGGIITITVPLDNVTAALGLTACLKNGLEVSTYPTAKFAVARKSLGAPSDKATVSGQGTGTMTLHGKTKDVGFTYKVEPNQGTYDIRATAKVDLNDFGVQFLCEAAQVKPDVEVQLYLSVKGN